MKSQSWNSARSACRKICFWDVPAKLVTQYRQRAGTEWPRELRRHPLAVRYTLLAALCWQREREITDDLVELLIHIAHHVGVRAEEKVNAELMKYAKKVMGKAKLLYKLAKAVTAQPECVVREVIYPVVCLTNDVLERFLADNRVDNLSDHALRLRRNSLGKLVQ